MLTATMTNFKETPGIIAKELIADKFQLKHKHYVFEHSFQPTP